MCQHNERFDEWWAKQVDNGGEWTTLERLAAKDAWEAATKLVEEKFNSLQQRYAKIAAELEQCAVDMNSDKLIPIVTCLNQWARLLRQ